MIIVTGGAGFIGSAIIWKLNQMGIENIIVVDNLNKSDKWKNLVNRKFSDYMHKSLLIDQLSQNRFSRIDAIIHMGACSSTTERDVDYLMENNFHYSVKLAEYALDKDIRFIYASSAATYGDGQLGFSDDPDTTLKLKPLNAYGYSKHLFDLWVLRSKALNKMVGLKFFNVFGPNEYHKEEMCSVIFKAFNQVKDSGKIRLFKSYKKEFLDGQQQRDFVYVKDSADLVWWFLENKGINGIYNVGAGKARIWNDLAKAVFRAMDVSEKIVYIDMPERLRDRYQYFTCARVDNLKATSCNINFSDLENGIDDYISNYLQQPDRYL